LAASPSITTEKTSEQILSASDICYSVAGKKILQKVSMNIHQGEIITLIGPNGAGKSTLIKCLLGILPIESGSVEKDARLRLAYVPQRTQLNPALPMKVEDFLAMVENTSKSEIFSVLEQLGVEKLIKHSLHGISGGEFQRVMLARAILRKPDLLVLDEPTQGIDISGQQELYTLLAGLRDSSNCSILMVSHDLHLVMSKTDHVICLNQHICCSGHPDSVSTDPAYLQLFGIEEGQGLAVYEHHHDHHHGLSGKVVKDD